MADRCAPLGRYSGPIKRDDPYLVIFHCPACVDIPGVSPTHPFRVRPSLSEPEAPVWEWNRDYENPTFSPSLLMDHKLPGTGKRHVCHLFVREGRIEYLGDCTHDLAGQTIDLPIWANGEKL